MSPLALSLHFLQAQPDCRLVALAREGHAPAFEALVRRYRRELLAYCRRLQAGSGGAEDALQQTLLQAWRALSAGADVRDFRPWLYRIAHNVTLNQLRAASPSPQDVSEMAAGQEVHQLVEQRLQARAALAGMASLPDLQRQAFVSTTLDGASHDEVASELGLSSGAVRGLVYRARATLRSAAAALTPSPALHWAVRRAEVRLGGSRAVSEMLAGGGGAGVAAVIAKGGAVLTLAGAVAGAGGIIAAHSPTHHHRAERLLVGRSSGAHGHFSEAGPRAAIDDVGSGFARGDATGRGPRGSALVRLPSRTAGERGRGSSPSGDAHGGFGGSTGNDGDRSHDGAPSGSSTDSPGGSEGGMAQGATIASLGGSSGGGSSGSSDGGSGGTSTSTATGSDGGGGSTDGAQATSVQTTSTGSSGSDGASSGTGGSSGSADTVTTSTP